MTVLVAVSGPSNEASAVRLGSKLSTRLDTELAVLYVQPSDEDLNTPSEAVASEAIENALSPAVEGRSIGRVGKPATGILSVADEHDAQYLVIGGRKRSPVGKTIFGSTTQSVLLNADCPVITVPQGCAEQSTDGPVVAAVDRSNRAKRVVSEAAVLASAFDVPIHVVHVLTQKEFVDLGKSVTREPGTGISMDEIRSVAADIASEAIDATAGDATAVGLVGTPEQRLIEYGQEHQASFFVASGRKQSPVGKVLFGSVTQSILLSTDRPVLSTLGD
jgi:nucleotide-binding universal stress UspA family protein